MDPRHARRYYRQELIEHQFWWQTKMGNTIFWFDNWTEHTEVYEVMNSGRWNNDKLAEFLPEDIVQHIKYYKAPMLRERYGYTLVFTGHKRGILSEKYMLPLDDVLRRMRYNIVLDVGAVQVLRRKQYNFYLPHQFLLRGLGINVKWATITANHTEMMASPFVPAIIIWELWKRRNAIKHEEQRSVGRCIYQKLERCKPKVKVTEVLWKLETPSNRMDYRQH
ncbi:hypothetical protein H5410_046013 [Solanum commersonii]|uniref:Uncharacterized protein n=1 Tax=Solanum commersonii TaxID=4109 RepID=A0A9J5XB41_SOLCO|nr:hypothetical protein H5410_046013 [Solanum commersonii]